MHVIAPYILAQYQRDLLAEARRERRARLARKASSGIPSWPRSLGSAFAYVARTVDPSREQGREPEPTGQARLSRAA
ncbi:MAG TPA: hypothetical protein VNL94_09940 [Candidatus Binatia bacterium]|nr:hypothetical protein [Candidatus Binatia bacterium]